MPGASAGIPGLKWKTVLGLLLIYVAVLFDQQWVWGLLFLFWTALAIRSGETYLVERLTRRANPLLFWLQHRA